MRFLLVLLLLAVLAQPALAQVEADSADVASIDAIIERLYAVISGPAEEPRDWDRFVTLFHESAVLVPTGPTDQGGYAPYAQTPAEYAERAATTFRDAAIFQGKGFYETEAARRIERFGSIAHVWSTYESRLDPSEAPFMRGINSIQLIHDGSRWWIFSVFWQHESPDVPLPDAYLID